MQFHTSVHVSVGVIPRSRTAGQEVDTFFYLNGLFQMLLYGDCNILHSIFQNMGLSLSLVRQIEGLVKVLDCCQSDFSLISWWEMISQCSFNCIFLIMGDVEPIFISLCTIYTYFPVKYFSCPLSIFLLFIIFLLDF